MDVRRAEPNVSEHALIVGRQSFQSFSRFMRTKRVGGSNMDERVLAQEWREIQQNVSQADVAESGLADNPEFIPLPDEMIPLAQEARAHESTQHTFGRRPFQWWLVEIDRAIVFQPWVDLSFVREMEADLPRPVSHEDHIRVAIGSFARRPNVTACQTSEGRYVFTSPSTDVRFLSTALLDPSSIQGHRSGGYATHVIGVFIGSGVNCLSAVHVDNRLVLINGTHRAYALRELGFTHIACLVTHVTNDDEKNEMLPPVIKQNPAAYLTARRPPLFKDYFDPAVRKIVPTVRNNTLLTLKVEQTTDFIPVA